jgi:hypothetical protein
MIFLFQKRNLLLRGTLSVIPRELDYRKTSPDWNTFIVLRIISNKLINILKKMITFNQFLTLIEGKKKEIKTLKSAYLLGREQSTPKIVDYGGGEPNSPEREAAIKNMMRNSGGGAVRKEIKKRENDAEKAAKKLLKP